MSKFGKIMYYLEALSALFPLLIISVPWWVNFILIFVVWFLTMFPIANTISQLAMWIWGFIVLFQEPFSFMYIISFILCAFWLAQHILLYNVIIGNYIREKRNGKW